MNKSDKEINSYQKHWVAGDQHYEEGAYEKAIKEWRIAKKTVVGGGYPYRQLPKVYRKLALANLKEGKYKIALKWYRELENLIKEAKLLIKKGKARSAILWNLKLSSRDEKQIKNYFFKVRKISKADNKEEVRKMRTAAKMRLLILEIVMLLFLLIPIAQASFWVKGIGFYYSPDYGTLKEELLESAPSYDVQEQLSAGSGLALSVGYDFANNWGIRLDTFKFTGIADYHHLRVPHTFYFKTSTSPVLISAVYRISNEGNVYPYLGAGIGKFPSELTITSNVDLGAHYTDSPTGWQMFAGVKYKAKGLFFSSEVRYISAKAEYPSYRSISDASTDWSGLFISLGIGFNL